MPEIEASEKRQGLHLACFRSTAVESKENFLARTPKMSAKCESQVSRREWDADTRLINLLIEHGSKLDAIKRVLAEYGCGIETTPISVIFSGDSECNLGRIGTRLCSARTLSATFYRTLTAKREAGKLQGLPRTKWRQRLPFESAFA